MVTPGHSPIAQAAPTIIQTTSTTIQTIPAVIETTQATLDKTTIGAVLGAHSEGSDLELMYANFAFKPIDGAKDIVLHTTKPVQNVVSRIMSKEVKFVERIGQFAT